MNYIQGHTRGLSATISDVWNGLRTYSLEFLLPEIMDELAGYLTSDEIDNAIKLLGCMNRSKFALNELDSLKRNDNRFARLDLMKILNALFDCSAIGNVRNDYHGVDRHTHKYRNPHAGFDPNEEITVHIGLWKSLNI